MLCWQIPPYIQHCQWCEGKIFWVEPGPISHQLSSEHNHYEIIIQNIVFVPIPTHDNTTDEWGYFLCRHEAILLIFCFFNVIISDHTTCSRINPHHEGSSFCHQKQTKSIMTSSYDFAENISSLFLYCIKVILNH